MNSLQTLASSREMSLRLGLVLFPLAPDGDEGTDCSNLDTWLTQYLPPESNDPVCLPAELLVSPVLEAADEIEMVNGEIAYITWAADTADKVYEMATDTFVVVDGKYCLSDPGGQGLPKEGLARNTAMTLRSVIAGVREFLPVHANFCCRFLFTPWPNRDSAPALKLQVHAMDRRHHNVQPLRTRNDN